MEPAKPEVVKRRNGWIIYKQIEKPAIINIFGSFILFSQAYAGKYSFKKNLETII